MIFNPIPCIQDINPHSANINQEQSISFYNINILLPAFTMCVCLYVQFILAHLHLLEAGMVTDKKYIQAHIS